MTTFFSARASFLIQEMIFFFGRWEVFFTKSHELFNPSKLSRLICIVIFIVSKYIAITMLFPIISKCWPSHIIRFLSKMKNFHLFSNISNKLDIKHQREDVLISYAIYTMRSSLRVQGWWLHDRHTTIGWTRKIENQYVTSIRQIMW